MKNETLDWITDKRITAIVRGVYDESCVALAHALYDGGISILEVTFDQRCPAEYRKTAETIRLLNKTLGGKMLFGAGTVTSKDSLRLAVESGSAFIVSPNTDPLIIGETLESGLVSVPGAMTPTEIQKAYALGADIVKVFPSSVLGTAYFKAIRGPISHIPLMATGGISSENAHDFLLAGANSIGVGGKLVNVEWIQKKEFGKITEAAEQSVQSI